MRAKWWDDGQKFQELGRHNYEELDLIVQDINNLGFKLQARIEALASQKRHLYSIFNSLSEGVAAFNDNGTAVIHNTSFREILGISVDHEEGIRFYDWIDFYLDLFVN